MPFAFAAELPARDLHVAGRSSCYERASERASYASGQQTLRCASGLLSRGGATGGSLGPPGRGRARPRVLLALVAAEDLAGVLSQRVLKSHLPLVTDPCGSGTGTWDERERERSGWDGGERGGVPAGRRRGGGLAGGGGAAPAAPFPGPDGVGAGPL